MADSYNTTKVDILHPLTTLNWELCHTLGNGQPRHCAVLYGRVAILTWTDLNNDKLFISSSDLRSWATTTLPYKCMSITTYKSQFVIVGGRDPSTSEPTDLVWTSDTGLKWQPSLPRMRTKRYFTSSVGTTSPEVLVVAGGCDSDGRCLDDVEVLIEDNWHCACPLPRPHYNMTSTIHQDEVVFTGRYSSSIYSSTIASLISSCTTTSTQTSPWRHLEAPGLHSTTISYSSCLVNVDEYGTVTGYCSMTKSWVEATSVGVNKSSISCVSVAAVLPTGDMVIVISKEVLRVKVSRSSFDPDSEFVFNVLFRLEAVMGIQIVPVLAIKYSVLETASGVKLMDRFDSRKGEVTFTCSENNPVLKVREITRQWLWGCSHRPPTWKQLLDVLQDIDLTELSQQIEAFVKGKTPFSVFMSVYPDLVCSVKPCVLTVADHCVGLGLISEDTYDQIIQRNDWIDTDKARCLLSNVRTALSATPQALEEFVSVLFKVDDCKFMAEKIQQQLH